MLLRDLTYAIRKRILIRARKLEPEWVEIIGVAAHIRGNSLATPGREQVYIADGYVNHGRVNRWALRVNGDPAQFAAVVRATVAQHDSHMVLMEVAAMAPWWNARRPARDFNFY